MIRNILNSALHNLSVRTLMIGCPHSLFCSSSSKSDVTSNLKAALQQQIKKQTNDVSQFVPKNFMGINFQITIESLKQNNQIQQLKKYFQESQWKFNQHDNQIQLTKINKIGDGDGPNIYQYQLKLVFSPRNPTKKFVFIDQPDEQMQIVGFIKKKGSQKWMVLHFVLPNINELQIIGILFVHDYQSYKQSLKQGTISIQKYGGPSIQSFDQSMLDSIFQYVQNIGIQRNILKKIAQFSKAREKQLYVNWLQDFKSFC